MVSFLARKDDRSALQRREETRGRAKGGLAALSSKLIDVPCKRLQTKTYRLQAQTLQFPNLKILWISVYLPTDPQTQNYEAEELLAVLGEIENIMDNAEYDDCIVQGDLNLDMVRQSGFSRVM